jgi:hypothetical protein
VEHTARDCRSAAASGACASEPCGLSSASLAASLAAATAIRSCAARVRSTKSLKHLRRKDQPFQRGTHTGGVQHPQRVRHAQEPAQRDLRNAAVTTAPPNGVGLHMPPFESSGERSLAAVLAFIERGAPERLGRRWGRGCSDFTTRQLSSGDKACWGFQRIQTTREPAETECCVRN